MLFVFSFIHVTRWTLTSNKDPRLYTSTPSSRLDLDLGQSVWLTYNARLERRVCGLSLSRSLSLYIILSHAHVCVRASSHRGPFNICFCARSTFERFTILLNSRHLHFLSSSLTGRYCPSFFNNSILQPLHNTHDFFSTNLIQSLLGKKMFANFLKILKNDEKITHIIFFLPILFW